MRAPLQRGRNLDVRAGSPRELLSDVDAAAKSRVPGVAQIDECARLSP